MGGKARAKPQAVAKRIVLALPKGRLSESVAKLFAEAGHDLSGLERKGRRLWADCGPFRVLVLRGADVATYVSHGIADVGVVGSDVLSESKPDVYQPLDLDLGKCRLAIAEAKARPVDLRSQVHLRVATKYPVLAREHFRNRGMPVEIVKLAGAVELAPLLGLADQIVDLVETGTTLRENGLVEVETILAISARLVVNRASFRLRGAEIGELIDRLGAALERRALSV